MSNANAIIQGNLAKKSQFLGDTRAEVTSVANALTGGWHGVRSYSVFSSSSWTLSGGSANYGVANGVFSLTSSGSAGAANHELSHRTILLGY